MKVSGHVFVCDSIINVVPPRSGNRKRWQATVPVINNNYTKCNISGG
jgi:hypothetical protein